MTERHLNDEEALDVALDPAGSAHGKAHAEACPACAARVAEAQAAWQLTRQARDAEVDPGEPFWRRQRAEIVARALAARGAQRERRVRLTWALSLAATALLAVVLVRGGGLGPLVATPTPAPLPAWTPLPSGDDDPAFELVAEAAPVLEEDEAEEPEALLLAGLSDAEERSLIEALRGEMGRES
jgi:hypothetical protein